MKNRLGICFFIFFLPLLSLGQQRWEKVITGDFLGLINNTFSYDEGELISTAYGGNATHKSIIYKLNKNGDILWQKYLFL